MLMANRSMLPRAAVLVACLWMTGCCHDDSTWHLAPNGAAVPDRWSNESMPRLGQDPASPRLRYDTLYVRPVEWGTVWYRFWPDGRAIAKFRFGSSNPPATMPMAEDGDDFSVAGPVRYCVIGDRIIIQHFSVDQHCWHFYTLSGTMDADGGFTLTLKKWEHDDAVNIWPRRGLPIHETFRPHVVGPMKRIPDWD